MNNLERVLVAESKKTLDSADEAVKEVKLLLASNAQEEISTLRAIGLDADIVFLEKQQEEHIIRVEGAKRFDRPVVSLKEIKTMCLNYRLYMKPAREYIGRIPAELGAELTRFCAEKKIAIPAHQKYSDFYIIAPPKMFKGYRTGMQILRDSWNEAVKERERIRTAIAEDPILVYKMDENHYAVIKSWGNDFAFVRRLKGFVTRRAFIKPFLAVVTAALFLSTVWVNFEYWLYAIQAAHDVVNPSREFMWEEVSWIFSAGVLSICSLSFWIAASSIENKGFGRLMREHIHDSVTGENEGKPHRHINRW